MTTKATPTRQQLQGVEVHCDHDNATEEPNWGPVTCNDCGVKFADANSYAWGRLIERAVWPS